MSTNWGYVCKSHNPPLESDHWFNHGEQALREAYANRAAYIAAWDDPKQYVSPEIGFKGYATAEPVRFLAEHRHCRIALRNEYGDEESVEPPAPELSAAERAHIDRIEQAPDALAGNGRVYSREELVALRCVDRHEWNNSGDPAEHGPAQYATGGWWPKQLRNLAARLENRARKYRIAADAMEREGNHA